MLRTSMSMIYDIHTHCSPDKFGEAIVQLTPDAFHPQDGQFYSVGLHPWDVCDNWRVQMAGLLVMALHPQVVMIGEAGIDKKHSSSSLAQQKEVFREHVRLSELTRKPLIVHCVKGVDEILAIRKEMKATLPWVIHGFRGGIEQWEQLTRAGLYVSVGKYYDEDLVKYLPLSHLFVESDDLGNADIAYERISMTKHIDESELRQYVAANIYSLLTAYRTE